MIGIDLTGRNGLVLGVANRRSLAWGIAERLGETGMRLALTYQGDRLEGSVRKLAEGLRDPLVLPCDVSRDEDIEVLFARLREEMTHLDVLVHSIAFAPREDLAGAYRDTSREGWRVALDISAYSLVALMHHATPLMAADDEETRPEDAEPSSAAPRRGGSVLAMSYMAAERAVPNYNVMGSAKAALEHAVRQLAYEVGPLGIRVNAVSAGPISTLSSRGVSAFTEMLQHHRNKACLRRNVTQREVADASLFLLTDLGTGVTGETLHVDGGYSIVGW